MAHSQASLIYGPSARIMAAILKKMGFKATGVKQMHIGKPDGTSSNRLSVCACNGVPTTDTDGYRPNGLYELCWDATNDDVYICSSYTDSENFTWTKIID